MSGTRATPASVKEKSWSTLTVSFGASCSSSPFFVPRSSVGHKTFWKYEGADGIVFNEVWPELHLPLSRHLGPTAVTLPRADFKKLAGTLFPSLSQIRPGLLFPITFPPNAKLSANSFVNDDFQQHSKYPIIEINHLILLFP